MPSIPPPFLAPICRPLVGRWDGNFYALSQSFTDSDGQKFTAKSMVRDWKLELNLLTNPAFSQPLNPEPHPTAIDMPH